MSDALTFEEIKVEGGTLNPCTEAELDAAEKALSMRFPKGYREFMTRLGRGVLAGHLIYVHAPENILAGRKAWQERVDTYWHWDEEGPPAQSEVIEGYRLGDTAEGDEFVVVRSDPDRIYVLPRDGDVSEIAGEGLMEALGWFLTSGEVREPVEARDFQPAKKLG